MKVHELQTHIKHPILITDEKMIAYLIHQRFHVSERFIGLLIKKDSVKLYLNNQKVLIMSLPIHLLESWNGVKNLMMS